MLIELMFHIDWFFNSFRNNPRLSLKTSFGNSWTWFRNACQNFFFNGLLNGLWIALYPTSNGTTPFTFLMLIAMFYFHYDSMKISHFCWHVQIKYESARRCIEWSVFGKELFHGSIKHNCWHWCDDVIYFAVLESLGYCYFKLWFQDVWCHQQYLWFSVLHFEYKFIGTSMMNL